MYPTITQYISAISIPESFATKTTLKPVLKDDGTPYFSSGGYAVVFKMQCAETHKTFALKCFLKEQEHRAESFRKISDYLATLNTPYLLPYEYLENELWVEDADFPVLLMEWVEGESLNEHLADLCLRDDTEGIAQLAGSFDALGLWLLEQELAHGDLKPDNIIVRNTGQIVLIDYDGLFVPTMTGEESRELGTQDWRHPQRKYSDFNRHLDDFSVLIISLSLHIFKASPALYKHNSQTDNLLFTEADYLNPYQSAAFTQARNWQTHEDIAPRLALLQYAVSIPVLQLIGLDVHLKRTAIKCTQFIATSSTFTSFPETVNGVSFKMVAIEGGTFTMGSPANEIGRKDNETLHSVTLSSFYMGQTAVTQALWKAVMGNDPSSYKGDNLPVENVNWNDCQEFIRKLNLLTGKKYRLQTEAEWEYAARGGKKSKRYIYAGSNFADEVAWFEENSNQITHIVATKKPNELELYDMAGNVWEWCNDKYDEYPRTAQVNPKGPATGPDRVIRGGSWCYDAQDCRSANRYIHFPYFSNRNIGFRVVLDPSTAIEVAMPTPTKPKAIKVTSPTTSPQVITEIVNGVSFKMVAIEEGTFTMGSPNDEADRKDNEIQHSVKLSCFCIGQTLVTQALWQAIMGANPSYFKGENLPVEQVSWYDCQEFIRKLNLLTGKKYRLPTEAEWEFAAKGGHKSKGYIYAGSNLINEVAWYSGNSVHITHIVATKKPNELELYDMAGNVWEWCSDTNGKYPIAAQVDPKGANTGSYRVIRGGSWGLSAGYCRSAFRSSNNPLSNYDDIGFRLVLVP